MTQPPSRIEALRQEWMARFDRAMGGLVPERDELAETFGGRTPEERAELERDKAEVARLERLARESSPSGQRSEKVLHWIRRKVPR